MFRKARQLHFVGIGGSGMNGIAEVLLNLGYKRHRFGPGLERRDPPAEEARCQDVPAAIESATSATPTWW